MQIINNNLSKMLSITDLLPNEITTKIFSFLDLSDLENVMITCKICYTICTQEVLPQFIKQIEGYDPICLPYTEPNLFKQCVLALVIRDCHIKYSELVHPNYACIRAIKTGKFDVYEKYCSKMNNIGYKNCLTEIISKQLYDLALPLLIKYPSFVDICFDQEINDANEKQFIEFIGKLDAIKTRQHQVCWRSQNVYKNIAAYGQGFFTDEIFKQATDGQYRPHVLRTEKNYISDVSWSDYATVMVARYKLDKKFLRFDELTDIWTQHRWDLWRVIMVVTKKLDIDWIDLIKGDNIDHDLPSHAISHLSLRTDMRRLFEKNCPITFEIKCIGLEAYYKFCNRNNIKITAYKPINKTELDLIFVNNTFRNNLYNSEIMYTAANKPTIEDALKLMAGSPVYLRNLCYTSDDIIERARQSLVVYRPLNEIIEYYNRDSIILPKNQLNKDLTPFQLYISRAPYDMMLYSASKNNSKWLADHLNKSEQFDINKLNQQFKTHTIEIAIRCGDSRVLHRLSLRQLSIIIPVYLAFNLFVGGNNMMNFCDYIRTKKRLHISYEYYAQFYQCIAPVTLKLFSEIYPKDALEKFYRWIQRSELPEHTKAIVCN